MPVDMTKIENEAPGLVSLTEKAHYTIDNVGLTGHVAAVVMAADVSPSARRLYESGAMQATAEIGIGVALTFDDDGVIPAAVFDQKTRECDPITLSSYQGYLLRNHPGFSDTSGTGYANAIKWCRNQAQGGTGRFGRTKTAAIPTYALFITDGEPTDSRTKIEEELRELERTACFIQFVGVGPGVGTVAEPRFPYLEQLDNLFGCGFFAVGDPLSVTDEWMLNKLMSEYPTWVTHARQRNLIN